MNSRAYANDSFPMRTLEREPNLRYRFKIGFHRFLPFFVAALLVLVAVAMFGGAILSLFPQKSDSILNSDQQPLVKQVHPSR